jgi:hypothetical protein
VPDSQQQTNIDSNLWAAAMAAYEQDKGAVDRARGRLRKNQLAYDKQGVPASAIRARYKERNMSRDERQQLYAEEVVSRRALALTLWDAESEEDFDRLMERATAVKPAGDDSLTAIELARIYNDAFNSGARGGMAIEDNPYQQGTAEHQQWALGCADGIGEKPREAPPMQTAQPEVQKRPRGRPRKQSASELLAENAAKFQPPEPEVEDDPDGGEGPLRLFDDEEMPETASIPE